jgi:glycine dehydrogenase subunit 2
MRRASVNFARGEYEKDPAAPAGALRDGHPARHYSALERRTFGVNGGFYPLGSCTMKYNPKLNERVAALPGFSAVHPLQPVHTVQGCLEALRHGRALSL